MRKYCFWPLVIVLLLAYASMIWAATTTSHTVTIQVNAINEIAMTGGNITLTINAAVAGSNPTDATNNTCQLQWTTNEATKKITVETNQSTPNYTLLALAASVTGGTAAAQATLANTTPHDFVTGISTTTGSCTINYTAQATAAQGTGSVVHTVLYTITAG
jgi:hypothetical protein